ncbi:hypothetical protein TWF694_007696 [Orbilia ellipsospora]|uniref:DUF6594 domain-containing protein n=1 Tax=Orbilia ellipsospora TaxID=2528407 RepID=A0AAV9XJG4_9PEZI
MSTTGKAPAMQSEDEKAELESQAGPSSSPEGQPLTPNQRREFDLINIEDGVYHHTKVLEIFTPSPMSLVAVLKPNQPPYFAQANLAESNIQEQVDAQNPSANIEAQPYMVNIPRKDPEQVSANASEEDMSDMNRMIHIPLEKPAISRDPNIGPDTKPVSNGFSQSRDPEKDAPVRNITFAPGYPSTAAIISTDPELSVYRRFDRLNARNFLYYQAELMYLESELDKMDEEDRILEDPEAKGHLRHFKELWDCQDERTRKRRRLVVEIRFLLKEYNESLYYYKDLLNCSEPSDRVVTSIRNWRANQGDPPISDISEQAYDKTYEADLIALKPPKCDDPLSIFAQNYLGKFFRTPQPAHIPNSENVLYYSETAIDLFVTLVCTLLAIIVLVGSMTTLFFVKSQGVRLGLVWVFTFLFAVSIFLMAKLSKGEIFLATAAYCAILVVYISGG